MIAKIKKAWVKALRSGRYRQGPGKLYRKTAKGGVHCCLGVLRVCVTRRNAGNRSGNNTGELLSEEFIARVGGMAPHTDAQGILSGMNDGGPGTPRSSFAEIADWIEKNL